MHFGHHHLWAFWFPALPQLPSSARLRPRSSSALCHPSPRTPGTCSGLFLPSPQHPQPPSSTAAIPEHARPRRGGEPLMPGLFVTLPSPLHGRQEVPSRGQGRVKGRDFRGKFRQPCWRRSSSPRPGPNRITCLWKTLSITGLDCFFSRRKSVLLQLVFISRKSRLPEVIQSYVSNTNL